MLTTTRMNSYLERLRQGDLAARNELVGAVAGRMRLLSQRMMGDFPRLMRWESFEDVSQHAILRLYTSLERACPESTEAFYRRAALQVRRQVHDRVRHFFGPEGMAIHERTNRDIGGSSLDYSDGSTYNPVKLATWTEFHVAINQLPELEKEVFDLLWYHELNQEEVGEILGKSTRQVCRYWLSARLRLGRHFGSSIEVS